MKFSVGEIAIVWQPTPGILNTDWSRYHGSECEIIEVITSPNLICDYRIDIDGIRGFTVMESELRKKPTDEDDESHYDGNTLSSWDAEGTVWRPERERELEYEE